MVSMFMIVSMNFEQSFPQLAFNFLSLIKIETFLRNKNVVRIFCICKKGEIVWKFLFSVFRSSSCYESEVWVCTKYKWCLFWVELFNLIFSTTFFKHWFGTSLLSFKDIAHVFVQPNFFYQIIPFDNRP